MIGGSFSDELRKAGVRLDGLAWSEDGILVFAADYPDSEKAKANAVLAAHVPPSELDEAKDRRCAEAHALREAKIADGISITAGEAAFVAQTRSADDWTNLAGITSLAAELKATNQTTRVPFRDAANVTRMLTPQQAVDMGFQLAAAKQAIVSASWAHKDAIRALSNVEAVNAYDLTSGWPG